MNETIITIVGNLTADPELRYTQSGAPVASFTIASTPRTFDRAANEWKDGEALFLRCSAWRELAENAAGSLSKGMRVVAQGRLQQRSYQDREGNSRVSIELTIEEIGPSLRYATASVVRAERSGGGRSGGASARGGADAWAAPGAAATPSGGAAPVGAPASGGAPTSGGDWAVSPDETPF